MRLFILFALAFVLHSCAGENNKPDVSDIKMDVQVERFEKDLFAINANNPGPALQGLSQRYPQFLPFYVQQLLRIDPSSADFRNFLSAFGPINDSLQKKYPNLDWLKKDLTQGFRYAKHYFPNFQPPRIITFISTFDAPGIVLTPHYLGIGLHQYAGKDFSIYQSPQLLEVYPRYISRRFDKEYMAANCMKAVVDDLYPDSSAGRPLIEQMIEKGKQWWLLHRLLPDAPDSVRTGFTQQQVEWTKSNEGNIWGYISSNVDIYTIDPLLVQDYIGEAPFTRGMPEGYAPGNLGQWVGLQIVRKFAEKNDKLSVQQVLQTPAKNIFGEAKYKPK